MTGKKGGRPVLPNDEKKRYKLTVHLSEPEYILIKRKASLASSNMSNFLRNCALRKEVKNYAAITSILNELGRIGNNLNQCARVINTDPNLFGEEQKNRLQAFMTEFRLLTNKILNL